MDTKHPKDKLAYRVSDLPKVLGIGRNAAYELCRRPDFPTIKVGNSIIIPIDALNQWLEAQVEFQLSSQHHNDAQQGSGTQ